MRGQQLESELVLLIMLITLNQEVPDSNHFKKLSENISVCAIGQGTLAECIHG